ncbi:hypothetical protein [Trinickia sp. EG282A]|uniref:hypothetical protein n=1 Tax=Trinickia sp. EG282A TaxID=3237013 RepID=UPI0034D350B4
MSTIISDTSAAKKSSISIERWSTVAALVVGTFVVLTTLYGVHRFYSPVPWWDEWDGYVGFYMAATNGMGFHAWWWPHMEHRIVTSRLLFWLDLRYFGGSHILLFAAQQAMLAGIVALIVNTARRAGASFAWTIGVVAALMFAWVQSEVLTWGFETGVIAVYFFLAWALVEFTCAESSAVRRFVAGFLLAACAEFSMGNGIAAPFALMIAAIVGRRPLREIAMSAVLSVALASIYFIGYVKPQVDEPHIVGSPLLHHLGFFAAFLGNPLAMLGASESACAAAGLVVAIAIVFLACRLYLSRSVTPYRALLIGICAFVIASDLAADYGRGAATAGAALASRYTTGTLLAWVAVLLLAIDSLPKARHQVMMLGVLVAASMATSQARVLDSNAYLYGWKLGVLSTKIGLEHTEYSGMIFPAKPESVHERFERYAAYSAQHDLGIYQREWLRDAGTVKFDASKVGGSCQGFFDRLKQDNVGLEASGWASSPYLRDTLIVLTDGNGDTIGYGVTGQQRLDVRQAVPGAGDSAGWVGFAQRTAGPVRAYAYTGGRFCPLKDSSTLAAQP